MQKFTNFILFDKLSRTLWHRSAAQPAETYENDPYDFGRRVEYLLETAEKQRKIHIARLVERQDPRAREQALTFTGRHERNNERMERRSQQLDGTREF